MGILTDPEVLPTLAGETLHLQGTQVYLLAIDDIQTIINKRIIIE